MLAPLLFNTPFAVVINVAYTRSKPDKYIIEALVHLNKKMGAGGRKKATAGEPALATSLWGMLYTDDAAVVSQSPEKLRLRTEVIVVMGVAFDFTVSKAKTEIMCLRTKVMPEFTAIFSVEEAGLV